MPDAQSLGVQVQRWPGGLLAMTRDDQLTPLAQCSSPMGLSHRQRLISQVSLEGLSIGICPLKSHSISTKTTDGKYDYREDGGTKGKKSVMRETKTQQ